MATAKKEPKPNLTGRTIRFRGGKRVGLPRGTRVLLGRSSRGGKSY